VSPHTPEAERDCKQEHAAREQDDVLARDRQQVIEPGAAEGLLVAVGQAAVVSEQYSFDERATFSGQAGRRQ